MDGQNSRAPERNAAQKGRSMNEETPIVKEDAKSLSALPSDAAKMASPAAAAQGIQNVPGVVPPIPQIQTAFQFQAGPDQDTLRLMSENERHEQDNKLRGYELSLDQKDKQSQRDHEYRMAQLRHSAVERYVVLGLSSIALVAGAAVSIKGNPAIGNPIMSAALTVLITMISGKWKLNS